MIIEGAIETSGSKISSQNNPKYYRLYRIRCSEIHDAGASKLHARGGNDANCS